MDSTNSETTGITTPKRHFDTMEESMSKMKIAFSNAQLPEIINVMSTVGYTAENVTALNTEMTSLEGLYQQNIKEHADETAEQKSFKDKKKEVNNLLSRDKKLLRILFKDNSQARVALQLDQEIPSAYGNWLQFASNLYSQLQANTDFLAKATTIGITSEYIDNRKQGIAGVQSLKESVRKEKSEAEAATETRNIAFDALFAKYKTFINYAKILLADNQLLEMLGVTV